jgi:flagellar biogenesis protein FliO
MSADGDLMTVLRVLASLVVVVVLVVVAARLARRAGVRGGGVGLRVVDRVGLTRETAVAVVEVAGRGLVLGTSAHGVTVLAELDPAQLAAAVGERGRTPGPAKVTTTRVVAPRAAATAGTGAALDPRTWRRGVDALRDLTVRKG